MCVILNYKKDINWHPIFLTLEKKNGYSVYSKRCSSQDQRQPILITSEEKTLIDRYDREHNQNSYSEFVSSKTRKVMNNSIFVRDFGV